MLRLVSRFIVVMTITALITFLVGYLLLTQGRP